MTATAATDNEADLRVNPGDGQKKPVNHIVRIVVVPDASDLEAAEHKLKNRPAPPPKRRPTAGAATSRTPNNLFEALEPTDIVVVGRNPASVRVEKALRKLFAHDHHHKDTVLRVWTESDTIEYQCDEEFEIASVEKAGWRIFGAPDEPFSNAKPYRAVLTQGATDAKPIWVWTSSVVPATANNQQYKMAFKIKGEVIDPDIVCGNPPPNP